MTNKQNQLENISTEDLKVWLEFVVSNQVHSVEHEKQLNRLSKRKVNLGDLTTIVNYLGQRNDGYVTTLIEQLSVMEYVLKNTLKVTDKDFKEAKENYNNDLKKVMEEAEKAWKDSQKEVD